jgi:hypothetical protein
MEPTNSFRINSPQVVHETIDGETVIIDMETGNYYSLQHIGADIWNLIDQGAQLQQILEGIQQQYTGNTDDIIQGVNQLLDQLQEENLILLETDDLEEPQTVEISGLKSGKREFIMPVLERFTDIQDLLLLDPIHEVDEAEGWPKQPQEQA